MRYLPVGLDVRDRTCLVVGAGPVASSKLASLLAAGARVHVVAPEVVAEIEQVARETDRVTVTRRGFRESDVDGAWLVFTATGADAVQCAVVAACEARGIWVNAVDETDRCSFVMPAVVDRSPVTIAVSTSGSSPALAGRIAREVEAQIGPEYADCASYMARLRQEYAPGTRRAEAFRSLLDEGLVDAFRMGDRDRVAALTRAACDGLERLGAGGRE